MNSMKTIHNCKWKMAQRLRKISERICTLTGDQENLQRRVDELSPKRWTKVKKKKLAEEGNVWERDQSKTILRGRCKGMQAVTDQEGFALWQHCGHQGINP